MKKFTVILCIFILSSCKQYEIYLENVPNTNPIIKVKLNNLDAYFLIDTGAQFSMISDSVVKYYNVNIDSTIEPMEFEGLGNGNGLAYESKNVNLFLNKNKIRTKFYITNIGAIDSTDNTPIIGILGSDVLTKYNMNIDFKKRKLTFED